MQGDVLVLDANAEHVARRRELRLGYEMTVNTNDRLHPPKAGVGRANLLANPDDLNRRTR
jgi:hypothetical protein